MAGTTPQVSFIIPAYNAARTLKVTARSLLAQTLTDWEAVIVDDGSSDRTAQIAGGLVRSDARFRLVRQDNAGPSAARNSGLFHAAAPLVTFIDADDWVAPDFLSSLVPLASTPGSLAFCGYQRILPSGRACPPDFCGLLQRDPLAVLAFRCEPAIHCVVAPRAAILEIGGFDPDLRCCEDWDLWLRAARAGLCFVGLNRALAFYRMEQGSLSTQNNGGERAAGIVAQRAREEDPRLPPGAPWRQGLAIALSDTADEDAVRAELFRIARGDRLGAFAPSLVYWRNLGSTDPDLIAALIGEAAEAHSRPVQDLAEHVASILAQFDPGLAEQVADTWDMACAKAEDGRFGRYLSVTVDLRAVPGLIDLPPGVDTVLLRPADGQELPEAISLPVDAGVTRAQIVQTLIQRCALGALVRASQVTRSPRFWSAFGARLIAIAATSPGTVLRNSRAVVAQAIRSGLASALSRSFLTQTRPLRRELVPPVLTVPVITANDSALLAPTIGYDQLVALIGLLAAEGYRGVSLGEVIRIRDAGNADADKVFALAFEDRTSARQCGFMERLPPQVASADVLLSPEELEAAVLPAGPGISFGLKVGALPLGTAEALAAARCWLAKLRELNGSDGPIPAKCSRPGLAGELLEKAGFAPIVYPGSTLRRLSAPGVVFPAIECSGAEALGTVVECLRAA